MALPDLGAFVGFLLMWIGYTFLAEHRSVADQSLAAVMTRHRFV